MIGDKLKVDGVLYEVVWSGGEGLIADRATINTDYWSPPPNRQYNKTGRYAKPKPMSEEITTDGKD